jgi:3-hydroxy-9,10-secoandrosta-1,3,5(10)-triene-9,17-dione monooxygenase reductase component
MTAVDSAAFRRTLARFATGVTVLTTVEDGELHGCTANAVSSLSLDPPLVLGCLRRESTLLAAVRASGVFAVNVLGDEQLSLARYFASRWRARGAAGFAGLAWRAAATGSPLLDGAVAHLDCRVEALHDGGDHVICVGRVVALGATTGKALVFADGAFGEFAEWPGVSTGPEWWPWI